MRKCLIYLFAGIFLVSCDTGPVTQFNVTLKVECRSGACNQRPGLDMIFTESPTSADTFNVCCEKSTEFIEQLKLARKKACVDKDFSVRPVYVDAIEIVPFADTRDKTFYGVKIRQSQQHIIMRCHITDELINKLEKVNRSCCVE